MKKKKSPEIIDVSFETIEQIKSRISTGVLLEEDQKIVLTIIGTYSWLMRQLRSTKFTIHRLKKVFGFCSEKHKKVSKNKDLVDFSLEGTSAKQALSLDNLQGINNKETPEKK